VSTSYVDTIRSSDLHQKKTDMEMCMFVLACIAIVTCCMFAASWTWVKIVGGIFLFAEAVLAFVVWDLWITISFKIGHNKERSAQEKCDREVKRAELTGYFKAKGDGADLVLVSSYRAPDRWVNADSPDAVKQLSERRHIQRIPGGSEQWYLKHESGEVRN
jgi:uncharacterized membrane protein